MIRHSRLVIVFTVILGTLPLWGQLTGSGSGNSVAAFVNKKIITSGMVSDQVFKNLRGRNVPLTPEQEAQVKVNALDFLIDRELVLQEYKEKNFDLPDSIFEKRIKDNMLKNGFTTRASLVRDLRRKGTTYDEYARRQREEIIYRIMLGEFVSTKGIVISPRKIEDYYIANKNQYRRDVEVKLQMIVLKESVHGGAEPTRQLADEIHRKLVAGDSFSVMAGIYCDEYARSNGFRPTFDKKGRDGESGTLAKPLEDVAFSLGQGQISGVVQYNNQCWIMRCDKINQQELRSLEEVREEIETTLMSVERRAREQKWFNKLREKAYVETLAF